jgi:hypothetical protein
MARQDLTTEAVNLISSPAVTISDLADGWPSIISYQKDGNSVPISLHISQVGSHARRDYELRFQNPGNRKPVEDANGYPILMGIYRSDPTIFVALSGNSRVGRKARFSILFNESVIQGAITNGFAEYINSSGEKIFAFRSELFPALFEIIESDVDISIRDLHLASQSSGFLDEGTPESAERARRSTQALVRHYAFGNNVKAAYSHKCAMCGLPINLIVGAHIYPASAPDSPDIVSNGISLCQNHHAAFDNHDLWINPDDYTLKFSPEVTELIEVEESVANFVNNTYGTIALPAIENHKPSVEMLRKRYQYYEGCYDWVNDD